MARGQNWVVSEKCVDGENSEPLLLGFRGRGIASIVSQPEKKIVPNALIGAAGVYYVASELSRRGLIALPTIRNTRGYDIIVAQPDGANHANIDVKTSQKRVSFWPMPASSKVCDGPNDYYVLLRWIKKEKRFEGFMLTGAEAKYEVSQCEDKDPRYKKAVEEGKPYFSVACVGYADGRDAHWKERWEKWRGPSSPC